VIPKETIALIRERTDIVNLMRRSGLAMTKRRERNAYWSATCPFCKAASIKGDGRDALCANEATGIWHCFACKQSGDCFRFLERTEGLSFASAVKRLADDACIALEPAA
jgi:DNA primase